MFNIQEFQAALSTVYSTVSKLFYMGKVSTVCDYIALNAR